jgi:hypothetical protein
MTPGGNAHNMLYACYSAAVAHNKLMMETISAFHTADHIVICVARQMASALAGPGDHL